MACADRSCSQYFSCLLSLPNATTGNVLGINAAGALAFSLPGGGGLVAGDLTTTTSGMTIGNGIGSVIGTGTQVNYNLLAGITALVTGIQGVLGGVGSTNTYVGGDGLLHLLPVAPTGSFTAGDLTTTTTGMIVGNGVGSVNGAGTQVNYNLITGIAALTVGVQGVLGGAGSSNQYVGGNGQLHQLPGLQVDTTFIDTLTTGNTVAFPATYTRILYVARNGLIQRLGVDYTLGAGVVNFIVPFGISNGATSTENVLIANLT